MHLAARDERIRRRLGPAPLRAPRQVEDVEQAPRRRRHDHHVPPRPTRQGAAGPAKL